MDNMNMREKISAYVKDAAGEGTIRLLQERDRGFAAVVFALAVLGVIWLLVTPVAAAGYTVTVCDDGGATPLPQGIPCEEVDKPEMVYVGRYWITGYDTCTQCCGKSDGITASGKTATVGRTIATGCEFAFGTVLYIDGIGERTVEDRGVKNGCIDVLCGCHADCYAVTGWYDVYEVTHG